MKYIITTDAAQGPNAKRGSGKHFNDFPLNFREISPADFWHWYGSYIPTAIEFRQPSLPKDKEAPYGDCWGNLNMLFSDPAKTEGYAFTTNWDFHPTKSGKQAPHDFWPRFFKFGPCIHKFIEKKVGNCLHKHTCTKCGKSYTVDSSD